MCNRVRACTKCVCVYVWECVSCISSHFQIYKLLMELINSKPNHPLAFPARLYYLFIIFSQTSIKVEIEVCLWNCEHMLPLIYSIYSTYLETPQRIYDKLSTYKAQQKLQNVCRNFVGKHTKNVFVYMYTQ